ncbi:hypothetical protein F5Y03DRAFT_363436 [Xylaria venustula]|nr:hypothetical protein F5Y03DRAFT_363436 [Xylaria venustula]
MDHSQSSQNAMPDTTTTNPTSPPALTRSPLSNRANIYVTHTTGTSWEHKDSSEGPPSTHDSVCDAAWISTSDVAKSPYQTPGRPVTPLRPIDIDLDSESPLSRLETPFLYGYGTELAPILEQRSIATMRTKGSWSTSDLSSLLHDAPGAENNGKGPSTKREARPHSRQLRRQHSFSLEDIPPDQNNTQQDQQQQQQQEPEETGPRLKWLSYSRPTVHVVDVHAYPRKPIYPPPQRPPTPPSLRRIRRPHSESDAYVASSSSGIAYEAPRFRASKSGHGNLSTHPFMSQSQSRSQPRSQPPQGSTTTTVTGGRWMRRSDRGSTGSNRGAARTNSDVGSTPQSQTHGGGGFCKKCHHPRSEWWSLYSSVVGHGVGVRRGADWCSRCACRKVVRACCCGEMVH